MTVPSFLIGIDDFLVDRLQTIDAKILVRSEDCFFHATSKEPENES